MNLKMEEADTMIAAGMGGGLVIHILNEDLAKTRSLKELILQPQSELAKVRRYLEEHRFVSLQRTWWKRMANTIR